MPAKKVAIMVDQQYQVLEVWFSYYRLREAGVDCDFMAAEAGKGRLSLPLNRRRQKREGR